MTTARVPKIQFVFTACVMGEHIEVSINWADSRIIKLSATSSHAFVLWFGVVELHLKVRVPGLNYSSIADYSVLQPKGCLTLWKNTGQSR